VLERWLFGYPTQINFILCGSKDGVNSDRNNDLLFFQIAKGSLCLAFRIITFPGDRIHGWITIDPLAWLPGNIIGGITEFSKGILWRTVKLQFIDLTNEF
jgi:hypothetical protein